MRFALAVALALISCKKADEPVIGRAAKDPPAVATTTTGTVANGVRTVQIEATKDGYAPEKIPGKPGEKLKLVFTRRESGGECMAELKSPDGKLHNLPLDKPYEIAVTVPNDGEVRFACGMDMFRGSIVAEKT